MDTRELANLFAPIIAEWAEEHDLETSSSMDCELAARLAAALGQEEPARPNPAALKLQNYTVRAGQGKAAPDKGEPMSTMTEKQPELRCEKCGESLTRLMLLAMIEDAGATVVPNATECSAGGQHDFAPAEAAKKETPR